MRTQEEAKEKNREKAKQAKAELFSLAALMKSWREADMAKAETAFEALEIANRPLNYYLKIYYSLPEGIELNTFAGWMAQGKKVKKGEKGLKFFSQPRKIQKENESGEKVDKGLFFGVSYLFTENQVENNKVGN